MKRIFSLMITLVIALSSSAITLSGDYYSVDTICRYPAGPGTWYTQVRMLRTSPSSQRLDVYILQVERKAPYVSTHTVLGRDSIENGECPSEMAQRKSGSGHVYFAGTNGDWWSTDRPGLPEGAFVTESTIAITPQQGRAGLAMCAIDTNDSLYFGHDFYTDVYVRLGAAAMRCNHVNDLRFSDELVLYNQYNGTCTHTDATGLELRCRIAGGAEWGTNTQLPVVVEDVCADRGNSPLDADHVVLSAAGSARPFLEQFAVGDTLTLDISSSINGVRADFTAALGGQDRSFMLRNGEIDNNWEDRHPRTGLGFSLTGDTIIHCVVDGRGASAGVSTGDLAAIMRFFGAWNAMNMEGGGSSTMYVRGIGTMNVPSDGHERAESQGIFCVSSAPDDDGIAAIAPYRPSLRLPRYGVAKPDFIGYNRYGILLEPHLPGVVLSCAPEVGYINAEGAFVCLDSGILHAAYGQVTADIPVEIAEDAPVAFRLDSALVSSSRGYTVEITTKIGNSVIGLEPSAFTWESADTLIAAVSDGGEVIGRSNGVTLVSGSLGDFSDTLRVRVQIPQDNTLLWNSMCDAQEWAITSSSGFSPVISPLEESPMLADLCFTYKTARSPFIRMGLQAPLYSLPDTICIPLSTDADIEKVAVGLRANNATAPLNMVYDVAVPKGGTFCIRIPVDSLLGTDPAIFPVWFDYIRFPLLTTTTAGTHHIRLGGVWLVYNIPESPADVLMLPVADRDAKKMLENGHVIIRSGGRAYTPDGRRLE